MYKFLILIKGKYLDVVSKYCVTECPSTTHYARE